MSRLRSPFLSDRSFFLTVKLLPERRDLAEAQFACLARCLDAVRFRQRFFLSAWGLSSQPWHAILFPPYPLTISEVMKSVKLTSANSLGRFRGETGELWQGRFFDHALRTVQNCSETSITSRAIWRSATTSEGEERKMRRRGTKSDIATRLQGIAA